MLIDLANLRLGGMAVAASDEFFAPKENLLTPQPPTFDPDAYDAHGKVMDGWETRRHNPDADWCIVRLGVTGVVQRVVVDTTHFKGNHAPAFQLHGTLAEDAHLPPEDAAWVPLTGLHDLAPDELQEFAADPSPMVSHVRLTIVPDGGVSRLRVLGWPLVDLYRVADPAGRLDLAALLNGARPADASDAFFSPVANMLQPGESVGMHDGWESRRRRDDGADWAEVQLATEGIIERVEIDTTHYKGNHPRACRVEALSVSGDWTLLVADAPLRPHARHRFDVAEPLAATQLRVWAIPDGGIARLRAFGMVTAEGWQHHGVALLDALPHAELRGRLRDCCGSTAWVEAMAARRPFGSPEALFTAAAQTWRGLDKAAQREAFDAHPRIGDRTAGGASASEQATALAAGTSVLEAIAKGNRAYEDRFGHVFLIRAKGRTAEEVLAALQERLTNDPATERRIAAEQQEEITRLRLEALLVPPGAAERPRR